MNYDKFQNLFLEKSKDFVENYDIDKANQKAIKTILSYFAGIDTKAAPLSKGLIIKGCVGSGKTITLKIIQQLIKGLAINNIRDIVAEFNIGGFESIEIYLNSKIRIFDDIGSEANGKYYGNDTNVVQELIVRRYEIFQNKGIITHFTTNEGNEQLRVRYGERAYDRLREMCTVIILGDNNISRRNKYNPVSKKKKPEISEIDKEKLNTQAIINFIKRLYNGEKCIDSIYVIVYDFLRQTKKLLLTEQRKKEITGEAIKIQNKLMEMESLKQMNEGNLKAAKNIFSNPKDLKTIKKKIAVKEYFENVREMEIEINEII